MVTLSFPHIHAADRPPTLLARCSTWGLSCFGAQQADHITYLCYWISMDNRLKERESGMCETAKDNTEGSFYSRNNYLQLQSRGSWYNWEGKTQAQLSNDQVELILISSLVKKPYSTPRRKVYFLSTIAAGLAAVFTIEKLECGNKFSSGPWFLLSLLLLHKHQLPRKPGMAGTAQAPCSGTQMELILCIFPDLQAHSRVSGLSMVRSLSKQSKERAQRT